MTRVTAFLIFLVIRAASAGLSDIFKSCKVVSCEVPSDSAAYPTFNPDENFKWMVAGLPFIFWDAVRTQSLFNQTDGLTNKCKQKLKQISDGLRLDEGWAYQFPDSSGKSPPAILKSTVSAVGDYDQCLDIDSNGVQGMYCMIDTHHLRKKTGDGQLALSRVAVFDGHPFYSALCLPVGCSISEIRPVLQTLLRPHHIKVAGDFHCDTKESVSYGHRLWNLTTKQVISIALVACTLSAVFVGTCFDVYQRVTRTDPGSDLLTSFSILKSSGKLFYSKPWKTYDLMLFDVFKTFAILGGTLAHVLICAEAPLAYSTISKHEYLDFVLKSPSMQFLQNDAGLLTIPFLTGVATFTIAYPMVTSGKLPYFAAIADRIIRFVPPLLLLLACEFVWPILGSGPMYTRVANSNLAKCEKNWFYNILFANNFIDSIDICGGHSFYSAVDMQLFLLGLVVLFAFSRSEKAGLSLIGLMVMFGGWKVAHVAYTHKTAFALLNTIPDKVVEYFTLIHMQTYSYMQAYFVGFLVALLRIRGYFKPKWTSLWYYFAMYGVFLASVIVANVHSMLHQSLDLYPESLSWLYISITRSLQLVVVVILFTMWLALEHVWDMGVKDFFMGTHAVDYEKPVFSPMRALSRLSFPLYICNYLYIRTEFFTRRVLEPVGFFWTLRRLFASLFFLYLFTIAFQLLLLAPIDALRQRLMTSRKKGDEKKEE